MTQMITHLQPDILECEVKWALGSIIRNKGSGGDGIPVQLVQILQDDAIKVLHSICQQIWKTQAVATELKKVSFHSNPKERQCQRMFKSWNNCIHFTCQQSNAQNSPSQASTVCELRTSRCPSWIQKRQRNQRSNCQHPLDHRKSKRILEKHLLLHRLCGSQQTVENSSRDGNTRPPYLSHEKPVCRSRSNSQNWTWNNGLVQNWERSMSKLYIVTLLI